MIEGWKRRVYPEREDEKNREPDDHGVQKARGLLHLSGVFSLKFIARDFLMRK